MRAWVAGLALIAAVAVIFGPSVTFPFLYWDDVDFILKNPLVVSPGDAELGQFLFTPELGYIIPVTVGLNALLYAMGGGEPWPFHLTNVLLHALVALCVFSLARRMSGAVVTAALAAAAFAVHPLVAEPVSWATGLKDLLAAACALSATALFVRRDQRHGPRRPLWSAVPPYGLAMVGMLAKPTVLLLGLVWLGWRAVSGRGQQEPSPWVQWARGPILLTVVGGVVGGFNWLSRRILEFDNLEVAGEGRPLLALGMQLEHALYPVSLHPIYQVDRMAGWSDARWWIGVAAVLGGALWAWAVLVRGRGTGPGASAAPARDVTSLAAQTAEQRGGVDLTAASKEAFVLGMGLTLVTYLPVSSIIPYNRFIADSYMYLPLSGLAVAVAPVLERLRGRLSAYRSWGGQAMVVVTAMAVVVLGAVLTGPQVARWSGHAALWTPLIREHPRWSIPYTVLAQGYRFEGRPAEAVEAYRQAFAREYLVDSLSGLGLALREAGDITQSECVMAEDLVAGTNPARAARNLALLLVVNPRYHPRYPRIALEAIRLTYAQIAQGWLVPPPGAMQTLRAREQQLYETLGEQGAQKPIVVRRRFCAATAGAL